MSEYLIGHLEVDSPFGNAGGVVKHVEDVETMARTGVGWIETGSYTLEAREGNGANGEVVYYHNPETGETFNSLGMPNKGMDIVEKEVPEMVKIAQGHDKPLIVNVAPVSDDPAKESAELVTRAYEAGADAVLLNAGCPNVVVEDGGRHEILSLNAEALELVLGGLKQVTEKFRPIFVRISPIEQGTVNMLKITRVIKNSGVISTVFTPNTWPGQKPVDDHEHPILEVPGGVGGKSGPATAGAAKQQTFWTKYCLYDSGIDVVSSGGITSGRELASRLPTTNAVAGAGTTFFYESGDWRHDVDKLLREYQEVR